MDVAIVCDNYKENEFVERLIAAGLDNLDISDFGASCKTIKITIPNRDKVALIGKISTEVENHFSRIKTKFN
jgi:hypothetical protein